MSLSDSELIHSFKKSEREDELELVSMAKIFTLEEYMKDENGEFVRKLKGGSEPEVKFSNLEKESSILEDEDSSEDEEEELSDAEFNMSELNGFLEKSNN